MLISHTDGVAHGRKSKKANILNKFHTHRQKWESKLVNQAWFGIFKCRANSLPVPKPMASPVDKMARFLKKPWTLFPHNSIICQKTENKKRLCQPEKQIITNTEPTLYFRQKELFYASLEGERQKLTLAQTTKETIYNLTKHHLGLAFKATACLLTCIS